MLRHAFDIFFEVHAFAIFVWIELTLPVCIFGVLSRRMDAATDRNYLNPFLKRYPATSSSGKKFSVALFVQARAHTHTQVLYDFQQEKRLLLSFLLFLCILVQSKKKWKEKVGLIL